MRRGLFAVFVVVALLALPGAANASSSTVTNGAPGEYVLNDVSNSSNIYGVFNDKQSGEWVIFDYNGGVSTSGTACIGRPFVGRQAVYCPRATWLKINANDGDDTLWTSVSPTGDANPFNGHIKAFGGPGDDALYGGVNDDELYGDDGNDTLDGQAGADKMVGGPGSKDRCCYASRSEGIVITLDGNANDGSNATDRAEDNVDASNEELYTGGGADSISTAAATIPAGATCTDDKRYLLSAGDGNDTLTGNFCFGDYMEGGDGYDKTSYGGRQVGVNVSQDGSSNDGRSHEGDNVRPSIEEVAGTDFDDTLRGADNNPDPTPAKAALFGGGGSDKIIPGTRAETLWADGWTARPGDKDEIDFSGRNGSVNVAVNDVADDGYSQLGHEEKDDVRSEKANGKLYGFDIFNLGQGSDTYYGPNADSIPSSGLPLAETPEHQLQVYGNNGDDQLYPGSAAEDLHGMGGASDRVSYILREPSTHLTQISLTMDEKANDGEQTDIAGAAQTGITVAGIFMSPLKGTQVVRWEEDARNLYVWHKIVVSGRAVERQVIIDKTMPAIAIKFENGHVSDYVKQSNEALTEYGADILAADKGSLARTVSGKLSWFYTEWARIRNERGFIAALAWPFAQFSNEGDNVRNDIEQLQGSTNTGWTSGSSKVLAPPDYIEGNDSANIVLGSPGPDIVKGRGGGDILIGDISGNPADDTLLGGPGGDILAGGGGADYVAGGSDPDVVYTNDKDFTDDGQVDQVYCGQLDRGTGVPWYDNTVIDHPDIGDVFVLSKADQDFIPSQCKNLNGTASVIDMQGSTLRISAEPGQRHKLALAKSGTQITVRDSAGATDVSDSGCQVSAIDPNLVSCSASGITAVEVNGSNLKDSVDLSGLGTGLTTTVNTDDGNDKITGSSGNDTIDAGPGKDKVKARGGDDVIDGGTGRDVLDGGDGSDTIDYSKRNDAVDVYLAQPSTKGNGETTQTLSNFDQNLRVARSLENDTIKWAESVRGGTGNDILQGNQLNNTIDAGKGDDALSGGDGDDQLLPGIGSDNILAGNGNDNVVAKDGYIDLKIDCGGGTDTGSKDAGPSIFDPATIGCEF